MTCDRSVVSSTNKTDCHDITEILMKVALNTINLNLLLKLYFVIYTDFSYFIFRVNRMIQERLNHAKAVSDVYAFTAEFLRVHKFSSTESIYQV